MKTFAIQNLVVADSNVRYAADMDENLPRLAASIRRHGLLQPLIVIDNGAEVEVVAGRRRLAAIRMIHEEDGGFDEVPCIEIDQDCATEASLAENYAREQMTPPQTYSAFAKVLEDNPATTEKDLAAMFNLELDVVRRTLRLGQLHPTVFNAYATGVIEKTRAEAYAAVEDQQLQADVFAALGPKAFVSEIHRALGVNADDIKLRVVGLEAYEAAGGRFERDLFNTHDQLAGRVLDPEILDRLATEQLTNMIAEQFDGDESIKLSFSGPRDQYGQLDYNLRVYPRFEQTDEQVAAFTEAQQALEEREDNFQAVENDEDLTDEARQALLDELEALEAAVEKASAAGSRVYPPGRKVAVPRFARQWEGDEMVEELVVDVYFADKEAKKEAEQEARRAEGEDARASGTDGASKLPDLGPNGQLTGRAQDFLAHLRKQVLVEACVDTKDGLQIDRYIYVMMHKTLHGFGTQDLEGFTFVHSYDKGHIGKWVWDLPCFQKGGTFDQFLELPAEQRQQIAGLLIAGMITNHSILGKPKLTWVQEQYGQRAEEKARDYWTPDAEFFDIFKKAQIVELIKETDEAQAALVSGMKVADAKARALTLTSNPQSIAGMAGELIGAFQSWIPSWLKLAPPAPKAKAAPKKAKAKGKKAKTKELADADA